MSTIVERNSTNRADSPLVEIDVAKLSSSNELATWFFHHGTVDYTDGNFVVTKRTPGVFIRSSTLNVYRKSASGKVRGLDQAPLLPYLIE